MIVEFLEKELKINQDAFGLKLRCVIKMPDFVNSPIYFGDDFLYKTVNLPEDYKWPDLCVQIDAQLKNEWHTIFLEDKTLLKLKDRNHPAQDKMNFFFKHEFEKVVIKKIEHGAIQYGAHVLLGIAKP